MNSKKLSVLMVALFFSVILVSCGKQDTQKNTTKEIKQKSMEYFGQGSIEGNRVYHP